MSKRNLTVVENGNVAPPASSKPGRIQEFARFDEGVGYLVEAGEPAQSLVKSIRTISRWKDGKAEEDVFIEGEPETVLRNIEYAFRMYESAAEDRVKWESWIEEQAEKHCDEEGELLQSYVSLHVAHLLGSFPTTKISEPTVFVPTLIEEIRTTCSDWYVLEAACRKMRRTMKAAPSIAAVLEAIEEEDEIWSERYRTAFCSQYAIQRLKKVHAATTEKVRQLEEARMEKERQAEQARAETERRKEFEALRRTAENASDVFALGERVTNWRAGEGVIVAMDGLDVTIDFDDSKMGRRTAPFRYFERATAPSPPYSEASPEGFTVGQRVTHSKFSAGTVVSVDGMKVEVEFDNGGKRILLAAFLQPATPVGASPPAPDGR
jgi:hypothetical protein